ncbi:MAG: hypothetical protein H8E42_09250 [Nitrospinae bacterium]|nr:hypothetical protein [Nitrospinota bacterium]MBL7020704.1 hypothetical protein [Nitrospinaceae bacterium]
MKLGTGLGLTIWQGVSQLPATDPTITKLLLHLDSDFSDSSIYNKIPNLVGAPSINTGTKVFGAGSVTKTGAQRIEFPASVDWDMVSSVPAQVSFRLFSTSGRAGQEALMAVNSWGPGWQLFTSDANTTLKIASNAGFRATWSYTFPLNTWTAHRFNHDGAGNYRWYVDGVLLGVMTPAGMAGSSGFPFYVGGRDASNDGFTGNIDEVKWEKHPDLVITTSATYEVESAAFKDPKINQLPPVNPFSMTKLQVHCDSDFSDSSMENNPPTLMGAPAIDTGEKVFGAGSLSRVPADRVTYPASTNWYIADGIPWQLSFRLFSKTGRNALQETFIANAGWAAGFMLRSQANWTQLQLSSNAGNRATWSYTFPLDTWTAHRINHDGAGNYRWYVNGILLGVIAATGIADALGDLIIGRRPDHTDGFTGNFDEVKWEKHADLVITTTEVYAVETAAFPNS